MDHAIEPVDIRLRSSSISRRNSPLGGHVPSRRGSTQGSAILLSPALGGRGSQIFGEDFAFDGQYTVLFGSSLSANNLLLYSRGYGWGWNCPGRNTTGHTEVRAEPDRSREKFLQFSGVNAIDRTDVVISLNGIFSLSSDTPKCNTKPYQTVDLPLTSLYQKPPVLVMSQQLDFIIVLVCLNSFKGYLLNSKLGQSVLGTKNLIRLEQTDPYGSIFIDIV